MKILTIISNFNEEREILNTINDFRQNATIESDLVVIDNWSQDRSIDIIKDSGVEYLLHPVNTGGGAGVIKTALMYAYIEGYDVYCHMDGDNQHNASDLEKLLKPIIADEADIVIGSRFIEGKGFQSTLIRRMGIKLFSNIVTMMTDYSITDITQGFRVFNRKAIVFFGKKYKHEYEVCVQMLLMSYLAGLRVKEVPIAPKPRLSGRSEINFINGLKFPLFGFLSLVAAMLQKKHIKELSDAGIH